MEPERINRFWAKANIRGLDECWLWTASVNSKGYGSFSIGGKKTASAHKISWALVKNNGVFSAPKDHIMHSCDTKRCVNPNHLELGTALQNNRDARARGTARNYRPSQEETCKNGHPRTPENTHHKYNTCVICMRDTAREAKKIKREKSRKEYNAYHREYYQRKRSAENGNL